MYIISKQYKQGKGIGFYDVTNTDNGDIAVKVPKDKVVEVIEKGFIENAKVQWWQGKPIVRIKGEEVPIVRVDSQSNETAVSKTHRSTSSSNNVSGDRGQTEVNNSKPIKAEVIGQVKQKKKKESIKYTGYDTAERDNMRIENSQIDFKGLKTIGEVFDMVADEFPLKHREEYKKEFAKKMNVDRSIENMNRQALLKISSQIAVYLMNMAYREVEKSYLKFLGTHSIQ